MTSSKQKLSAWSSGEISGTEAVDIIRSVWKLGGEEGYWSEYVLLSYVVTKYSIIP